LHHANRRRTIDIRQGGLLELKECLTLLSRDAQRLRPFLLGALFLSSLGHHRPAIGYTMTVWSDPYDSWGCVGARGG
jgi:hypothetical protein